MKEEEEEKQNMSSSKFSLMQSFLQRVLDSIAKPNDEERTEATYAVRKLQERLMNAMKDLDDFFVAMNPSFSLKGSVKKKLKVGLADEFDLNLTMRLPLDESRMNEIKVSERIKILLACARVLQGE